MTAADNRKPPPLHVLQQFGVEDTDATLADGGQGTTWRVGVIAIKPCSDPDEAEWLGAVLSGVRGPGFRVAEPVRGSCGRFVIDGWSASLWIDGDTRLHGRHDEVIAALRMFNTAVSRVPRPTLPTRPKDAFAIADEIVWSDPPYDAGALDPREAGLLGLLRPVRSACQLIQGDPSEGNFVFSPGLPPALIDVSPYWRPPEYAVASYIADAITWSGAPPQLLDSVRAVPDMGQLLYRAVLFRLIVARLVRPEEAHVSRMWGAYERFVGMIGQWEERS